jgi:hypothetical protein
MSNLIKAKNGRYYRLDPPEQCRTAGVVKAFPEGGGFGCRIPVTEVVEWDATPEHVYRLGWVGFDGEERYIRAWTAPTERWNGWAHPYAERAEVEKFIQKQAERAAENGNDGGYLTAGFDGNELVVHDPNYDEADSRVPAETILVPDPEGQRNVEVWDLSLGLCWEEAREDNPRFVWIVGAIREQYPDVPEAMEGQLVLWDRQEKKPVVTVFEPYANGMCLETTRKSGGCEPFTELESFFNELDDEALTSEGMTATREEYYHA